MSVHRHRFRWPAVVIGGFTIVGDCAACDCGVYRRISINDPRVKRPIPTAVWPVVR